jgi:hypothetical protein
MSIPRINEDAELIFDYRSRENDPCTRVANALEQNEKIENLVKEHKLLCEALQKNC